jgi:hypothetical protein
MPKFEIELDEKGEFLGTLPTEFTAVLDKLKSTAHGEGFGKGNQKAAEEAKKQIEMQLATEKAKWDAGLPGERAKWDSIEDENKHLKTQLDTTLGEQRKRMNEREEAHAQEVTRRAEREAKRDTKIRDLVNQNLKSLAARAGARDESLAELEVILQHRIGYTDDMEWFVKDEAGQPAKTTAGNPLPLDVFVKQYLDNHPHHRKAAVGQGGGARGGASFGGGHAPPALDTARARVEAGDRSPDAINDLFNATRKKGAA